MTAEAASMRGGRGIGIGRWCRVIVVAVAVLGVGPRPVAGQTCVGDCRGEGVVDIGDLITGVNIVLGSVPLSACPAFENAQGVVDVARIIQGVNNALNGCPVPVRFVDNRDGTITDSDTGLVWEKKDQAGGLHDYAMGYVWAGKCADDQTYCQPDAAAAGTCSAATGGAVGCAQCAGAAICSTTLGRPTIWQWLNQINAANFGGHDDWRLPTVAQDGGVAELDTIVDTSAPGCGSTAPCVPRAFDSGCAAGCAASNCSCTQAGFYWSVTSLAGYPQGAWEIYFYDGSALNFSDKTYAEYTRAVRGGS